MLKSGSQAVSRYLAIGLFVLSATTAVFTQNLSGTWAGYMDMDSFIGAVRFDFSPLAGKSGPAITMFFAGDSRGGAIENIKRNGDDISFEGAMQPRARYTGKISGEQMSGTFEQLSGNGTVAATGAWEARHVDPKELAISKPTAAIDAKTGIPSPKGSFTIGRKLFYWTDESRPELMTADPNDKRRVFAQLWYPAKKGAKGALAPYFIDSEKLVDDKSDVSIFGSIKTHAIVDAPLLNSKERFPLIVFSPGLGTSPFNYTAIIEGLASRGYAVLAVNHSYDSGPVIFPDGTTIKHAADKWDRTVPKDWSADDRKRFFDERRIIWAQDISFAVDQLQKNLLAASFDFSKLGLLGHSFGGQAATIACASDTRFKACANLDGQAQGNVFLPDAAGKQMAQPFLFFTKAAEVTDQELLMMGMSRSEYRGREKNRLLERWKPSFKSRIASLASGGYVLTYPGITHGTFSDGPLIDDKSTIPYDERAARAQLINEYIREFFDKYLQNKPSKLLEKNGVNSDGIIVEYLKK